jgi:hypothetical protein
MRIYTTKSPKIQSRKTQQNSKTQAKRESPEREGHAPAYDNLSHAGIAADRLTPPTTEAVGEKWEQRDPHTPTCEMHMLTCTGHALLGKVRWMCCWYRPSHTPTCEMHMLACTGHAPLGKVRWMCCWYRLSRETAGSTVERIVSCQVRLRSIDLALKNSTQSPNLTQR